MGEFQFLYDVQEEVQARYVSFFTDHSRFDLAIIRTDRFFGKSLVLDIQSGKFAILGQDDLDEPGYLEHTFAIDEQTANDLRQFLYQIIVG